MLLSSSRSIDAESAKENQCFSRSSFRNSLFGGVNNFMELVNTRWWYFSGLSFKIQLYALLSCRKDISIVLKTKIKVPDVSYHSSWLNCRFFSSIYYFSYFSNSYSFFFFLLIYLFLFEPTSMRGSKYLKVTEMGPIITTFISRYS